MILNTSFIIIKALSKIDFFYPTEWINFSSFLNVKHLMEDFISKLSWFIFWMDLKWVISIFVFNISNRTYNDSCSRGKNLTYFTFLHQFFNLVHHNNSLLYLNAFMTQKLLNNKNNYNYWVSGNTWKDKILQFWCKDFSFSCLFVFQNEENVWTSDLTNFSIPEPKNLLMTFLMCIISNSDGWSIVSKLDEKNTLQVYVLQFLQVRF